MTTCGVGDVEDIRLSRCSAASLVREYAPRRSGRDSVALVSSMRDPQFGKTASSAIRAGAVFATFQVGLTMSEETFDGVTIVSRDLPVGGARTLASTQAPIRFDLVGLHWQGSGGVLFRTRSLAGRWSGCSS